MPVHEAGAQVHGLQVVLDLLAGDPDEITIWGALARTLVLHGLRLKGFGEAAAIGEALAREDVGTGSIAGALASAGAGGDAAAIRAAANTHDARRRHESYRGANCHSSTKPHHSSTMRKTACSGND